MKVFHMHSEFVFLVASLCSIAVIVAARKFREFRDGDSAAMIHLKTGMD